MAELVESIIASWPFSPSTAIQHNNALIISYPGPVPDMKNVDEVYSCNSVYELGTG